MNEPCEARYEFWVDRPPDVLSPNARAGWQAKHRAMVEYGEAQGYSVMAQLQQSRGRVGYRWGMPWRHGRLHSTHYFRRHAADADNCIGILKAVIDMLQQATKRSGNRFRLGLIKDDRHLEIASPSRVHYDPAHAGRIRLVLEVWS